MCTGHFGCPLKSLGLNHSETSKKRCCHCTRGLPTQILRDLLQNTKMTPKDVLSIVNLTPWDGTVDLAAAYLPKVLETSPKIRVLSISADNVVVSFSGQCVAERMMEEITHVIAVSRKRCVIQDSPVWSVFRTIFLCVYWRAPACPSTRTCRSTRACARTCVSNRKQY